jgi:hypothetical protein
MRPARARSSRPFRPRPRNLSISFAVRNFPLSRLPVSFAAVGVVLAAAWSMPPRAAPPEGDRAERQAVADLAREVAAWKGEHKCYSCHNNGDAARALFAAWHLGFAVDGGSFADTLDWLKRPADWNDNGPEGPFSDRRLADLQFAVALSAAADAQLVGKTDQGALRRARQMLAEAQLEDGSWPVGGGEAIGGPVTYGKPLATSLARRSLSRGADDRWQENVRRAGAWLARQDPRSVVVAASVLIGLEGEGGEAASRSRRQCLDGSWPETTRPADRESYAHRISTTAWATLALLATRKSDRPAAPAGRDRPLPRFPGGME